MTVRYGNHLIAGFANKVVFTLSVVPLDAVVSFTGGTRVGNSVIASIGSVVHWTVSKDGYETQEGDKIIGATDETLLVELKEASKEVFKFTVNSGSDSQFILPLSSTYSIENNLTAYNMNVDWGDGQAETITGVASKGNGVTHTYANANQDYEITLTPAGDEDGWGVCFGFHRDHPSGCNDISNKKKMRVLSSPMTQNMIVKTGGYKSIGERLFRFCTELKMGDQFNLPKELNLPKEAFSDPLMYLFNGMFEYCFGLNMSPVFNIPTNITYTSRTMCTNMFFKCTALELNGVIQVPQGMLLNTSYVEFEQMFKDCTSIKTGVQHFFGNLQLSDPSGKFRSCFSGCTGITEEISAATIPQLTVSPRNRNYCFLGANPTAIANCPPNWK